jgi:streptogramin lyase
MIAQSAAGQRWPFQLYKGLMRLLPALAALVIAVPAALPGTESRRACAGAGPFWPTETLAVRGGTAWVACKEEQRLVRVKLASGALQPLRLDGSPIAVLAALGAVWTLDTSGVVTRVDPRRARVTARIETGMAGPYNLWAGAGSLWSADDRAGQIVRIDPARRRVSARITVGDGPADMVFRDGRAWVINHRDLGLVAIDTATNRARKLVTLGVPHGAPERIAWAAESLWVTGRGTDLLRLDPNTGTVQATIEIGASGIDVAVAAGSIWVPTRNAAVDARGFPTMSALRRVDPATGRVTTPVQPRSRVDVHGLVPYGSGVLFADNTGGRLYAVPRF